MAYAPVTRDDRCMNTSEESSPLSDSDSGDTPMATQRGLFRAGDDPDPRFTLANERTFLSWIRTALAFVAGGIAVEAFTQDLFPVTVRQGLAVILLLLGMLLAGGAAVRWVRVETAMRTHRALPIPLIVPIISIVSALAAGALALVIALAV